MKSQGITIVITVHPAGNMNVCTNFNGNLSRKVNLLVALDENVRGSLKLVGFILWRSWISVQNVMAILLIVVQIFNSGSYFLAAFQQCECHAGANQASVRPQGVRGGPGDGHSPSDHELPLQLTAAAYHHSRALRLLSTANPSSPHKSGSANIAV